MATEFISQIGSGNQPLRKDKHGDWHRPALAVAVVNWEDANPVYEVYTSGFTVDDTAGGTLLPPGGSLATRRVIAVYNNDSTDAIYVGPSGITENNGYPVGAGTEKAFSLAANLDLYAIAAAGGSVDVRTMEIA
jgi:hypothetical protein